MAAGRPPSPDGTSRRRDQDRRLAGASVPLPSSAGAVFGNPLPGADRYAEATREWFETWRRAPQAVHFTVTDWQRLHMLAELVDQFWDKPTSQLMAEIRLNEERLGATPIDRLRLGYKMPLTSVPNRPTSQPAPGSALERAASRAGAPLPHSSSRDRLTRLPAPTRPDSREVS